MWWYIMLYYIILRYIRRKFRSQTCDNMDRWKSKDGKSQRREEEKRSEKRTSQKKEDAGARAKLYKSCDSLCFSNDVWLRSVEK